MINFKKFNIMGVLNVTPDSFYDGGRYFSVDKAIKKAEEMIKEGCDIIDVGGESTRPGSKRIAEEEEIKRTIPVIEGISKRFDIPISIDTYKPDVAKVALESGATIVNDIYALRFDEKMVDIVKKNKAYVVLMHMQGTPETMQVNPVYRDVVKEIFDFFVERTDFCIKNGIEKEKIILDPGIGFGKTTKHNLLILKHIEKFKELKFPIMVGPSRKSFIGRILRTEENPLGPEERLVGSLATYAWLFFHYIKGFGVGINILRVHDVKETLEVVKILGEIANVDY